MNIYAESALHNSDVLPYGTDTFQIVDEDQGGVIAYCHASNANSLVAALRAAGESATAEPKTVLASTLGSLIKGLEEFEPKATVVLEYQGALANPGKTSFYRGYHDELAISPDGTVPVTVSDLVASLQEVMRSGFSRPGTERAADDTTGIWVAKYREYCHRHVVGIRSDGNSVVILTEERDW